MASHYDPQTGRRVTAWEVEPISVHGGFQLHHARWVKTDDGWDQDYEPHADRAVYPNENAALAAAGLPLKVSRSLDSFTVDDGGNVRFRRAQGQAAVEHLQSVIKKVA